MFAVSHAGTTDPSVPDERYRKYGDQHECVVRIKGKFWCKKKECNKEHDFLASAVAIKPHWVLTAAHVVNGAKDVTIVVRGKEMPLKRVVIKKGFDDDKIGLDDIAIGYCGDDIGLDFYPDLYDGRNETGKVASICGYGMYGSFSTGAVNSDGNKRAGSNIVEKIEGNCLMCSNMGGKKTSMEFMIASGDSGGGMFIDGKLAGINSFVMATDGKSNSDYGDECAHTRISDYIGWINDQMEKDVVQEVGEEAAER